MAVTTMSTFTSEMFKVRRSSRSSWIKLNFFADHILTLRQSLADYERMLSSSHPTYLAHLRLSVSTSKSGSDKAIAMLTTVSMAVLVMQGVIGESI